MRAQKYASKSALEPPESRAVLSSEPPRVNVVSEFGKGGEILNLMTVTETEHYQKCQLKIITISQETVFVANF